MNDRPEFVNRHGLRKPGGQELDIIGIFQTVGETILGVMVAGDDDHANAGLTQAPHAIEEK
jgi:hypothetical protein